MPTRRVSNFSPYRGLAAPLASILLPYITAASLSAIDHGPLGFQPATPGLELAQAGLLLLGIPLSAAGVLLLGGLPMSDRGRAVRLLAGAAFGAFQLAATVLLCVILFEPRGS